MKTESNEMKAKEYSALKIAFVLLEGNDVLCGSKEVGIEWADGNDGWDVFD